MTAAERMLPPASSKASAQEVQVDVVGARAAAVARQRCHRARAGRRVGHREVDDHVEPAGERLVEVGPQVGGQHRQPVEGLHPLQQVGALDVGVPVVGVADLACACRRSRPPRRRAAPPLTPAGLGEDPLQVLLGLPDVLVDDGGQVDRVQVEPQVAGDHLGGHRLAGARVPGEQRGHARGRGRRRGRIRQSPQHLVAVPGPRGQLVQPRAASAGGSTRSSQPTSGSIRRASRSRPAAFWARAPRAQVRRADRLAGGRRRAARPTGRPAGRLGGPRTKWAVAAAGSSRRRPSGARLATGRPARRGQRRRRRPAAGAGAVQRGIPGCVPTSSTGTSPRRAGDQTAPRLVSASTGPTTSPAPGEQRLADQRGGQLGRRRGSARQPGQVDGEGAPAGGVERGHRQRRRAAAGPLPQVRQAAPARASARPSGAASGGGGPAGRPARRGRAAAARARRAPSSCRPPGPAPAARGSATAGRGRPPAAAPGRSAARRRPAGAGPARRPRGNPHSRRARPTEARRRVTSSLR